jgi:hypothetical protein
VKRNAHWRRDEPTFYNFLQLPRTPIDAPDCLRGLRGALMSHDPNSGSVTWVVELPAPWRSFTDSKFASLELFVLRGDVALNGDRVGSSGYLHLPQLCGGGELRSEAGAVVLVFWNPHIPSYPYPVTRNRTCLTYRREWTSSIPGSHGVMHKSLRLPDPIPHPQDEGFDGGPGGYLRLQYIPPQMISHQEHVHHECWEEIILLQGDVMLLNEGQMGIGSVVGHPQEWYHAPFVSRSGAVILVHTDGPMGFPWPPRAYPNARELCECYLANASWDVPTPHLDWSEHSLSVAQECNEGYRRWRNSPEGALWSGADSASEGETNVPYRRGGRGTAARFRAGHKRLE